MLIWWVLILLILFIKSFLATDLKSSFFLYHLFWRTCKQDQIYLIGWTTSFSFTGERGLTLSSPSHKLLRNIWDKVFKNGPSKVCRRQPLKNLKGLQCLLLSKAVLNKFYLIHSWYFVPLVWPAFVPAICFLRYTVIHGHWRGMVMPFKNERNYTCLIIFKRETKLVIILLDLFASPTHDVVLKFYIW